MDIRFGAAVRRALQSSTDVFYATRVHLSGRLHQAGHAHAHTPPTSIQDLKITTCRRVAAKYSRVVHNHMNNMDIGQAQTAPHLHSWYKVEQNSSMFTTRGDLVVWCGEAVKFFSCILFSWLCKYNQVHRDFKWGNQVCSAMVWFKKPSMLALTSEEVSRLEKKKKQQQGWLLE